MLHYTTELYILIRLMTVTYNHYFVFFYIYSLNLLQIRVHIKLFNSNGSQIFSFTQKSLSDYQCIVKIIWRNCDVSTSDLPLITTSIELLAYPSISTSYCQSAVKTLPNSSVYIEGEGTPTWRHTLPTLKLIPSLLNMSFMLCLAAFL